MQEFQCFPGRTTPLHSLAKWVFSAAALHEGAAIAHLYKKTMKFRRTGKRKKKGWMITRLAELLPALNAEAALARSGAAFCLFLFFAFQAFFSEAWACICCCSCRPSSPESSGPGLSVSRIRF